jgi:hypothetical protein
MPVMRPGPRANPRGFHSARCYAYRVTVAWTTNRVTGIRLRRDGRLTEPVSEPRGSPVVSWARVGSGSPSVCTTSYLGIPQPGHGNDAVVSEADFCMAGIRAAPQGP